MTGYIEKIKTKIPNSNKEITIDVQGRNIIITGGNGCGKTQLLNHLYNTLERRVVGRKNYNEQELTGHINNYNSRLKNMSKADSQYQNVIHNINTWRSQLEETRNQPAIINDIEKFVIRYHENKALFIKFDATRQANIKESKAAVNMADLIKQATNTRDNSETASLFEEYLVSNITAQAYAESPSINNNQEEAYKIKTWFNKLQNDLRELFEDPSLKLAFDSQVQGFLIKQDGKEPYRFQQLSSGFSSILSVYADLLTKVELRSIVPDEIDGVVFIDEIDAHLHVSLQRKIFAFLVKAFPKVQFIVTTHSPFVVSSVNDSVIYDLSRLEQVDDLSMYSYEAVLDGLFNILPISEILKGKIIELSDLTRSISPDRARLKRLVAELSPYNNKLDSESAYFLKVAEITINKEKCEGE